MLEMKPDERLLHTRYDGTQVLVVHASIKHWMFTFCRLAFVSDQTEWREQHEEYQTEWREEQE